MTAANGTKITYSGWVEIEVQLTSSSKDEPSVMVPFLITNENLEYPILGYNVIEELAQPVNLPDDQSTHIAAVQASFHDLDEIVLLDLIELIQGTKADRLCTIKSSKRDVVIPAKRTIQLNCRANTGPVEEAMPVLFEPDELTPWPQVLAIHETVTAVKRGSTSKIKIDVIKTTNHGIVLRKHTILGSLQLVKSITPVEVKLAENAGEETETSATVSQSQVTMTEEPRKKKIQYDKKVKSTTFQPGDRVLIRNVKERGGPGKLRSYWEDEIYKIVCQKSDEIPVYDVIPESGEGKTRTLHRNMLFPCSYLPVEKPAMKPSQPKRQGEGRTHE